MTDLTLQTMWQDAPAQSELRNAREVALAALKTHLTQDDATEIMKPTIDEHGNWTTRPAAEIDGDDKRVVRARNV